ncbi:hypothetical protein A2U01_0108180, partial [Trifolium medium]|nr:hypothetical protein [Trifolium medium]
YGRHSGVRRVCGEACMAILTIHGLSEASNSSGGRKATIWRGLPCAYILID